MSPRRKKIETEKDSSQIILEAALELFNEKGFEKTTMREIAKKAGMALGAAYYYFPSKEAMVMSFYLKTQFKVDQQIPSIKGKSANFYERFSLFMQAKFELLKPSRTLLKVINGIALNLDHPLSPFSEATRSIREESIQNVETLIAGSNLKLSDELTPLFPRMIWLLHMALLAFWIQDSSAHQKRTHQLLGVILYLMEQLLRLLRFPFPGQTKKKLIELLEIFHSSLPGFQKEKAHEENEREWSKEFVTELQTQFKKENL